MGVTMYANYYHEKYMLNLETWIPVDIKTKIKKLINLRKAIQRYVVEYKWEQNLWSMYFIPMERYKRIKNHVFESMILFYTYGEI